MARRRLLAYRTQGIVRAGQAMRNVYQKMPAPVKEAAKSYVTSKAIQFLKAADTRSQRLPSYVSRNTATQPGSAPKSPLTNMVPTDTSYRTVGTTNTYLKGDAPYLSGESVVKYRLNRNTGSSITGTVYGQRVISGIAGYTAAAQYSAAALGMYPGTTRQMSIQLAKLYSKLCFHNMDRVTARIFLYDLVAAQDMPATDNTPQTVLTRVAAQYDTIVAGDAAVTDLDVEPEDFPNFRKQWRIVKKTVIDLEPGKTHYHNYSVYRRYPVSEVSIQDGDSFFKGASTYQLMMVQSAPVRDAVDSIVSIGTPDIIYTHTSESLFLGNLKPLSYRDNAADLDISIGTQNVRSAAQDQVLSGDLTNIDTTPDADP